MRSASGVVDGFEPLKSSRLSRRAANEEAWIKQYIAEAAEEARYNALSLRERIDEADDVPKLKVILHEILTRLVAEGIEL